MEVARIEDARRKEGMVRRKVKCTEDERRSTED